MNANRAFDDPALIGRWQIIDGTVLYTNSTQLSSFSKVFSQAGLENAIPIEPQIHATHGKSIECLMSLETYQSFQ